MALKLTKAELQKLFKFIEQKTGMSYEDEKLEEVYNHKLRQFIESLPFPTFNDLMLNLSLNRNKKILSEIINRLTVNETYFFRESYQFDVFINYAVPEIVKNLNPWRTIRILSAPCSTGEEVYSIMIYLLEEGNYIRDYDFMVLGIDIDSEAIEKAKRGIYSKRSVHKLNKEILRKYFVELPSGEYQVVKKLRMGANFKVVNVLNEEEMKKLGKFDVIFSRNMLIYFKTPERVKVLSTFYEILNPGGFLFLGHAEKMEGNLGFKTVKVDNNFFFQKPLG